MYAYVCIYSELAALGPVFCKVGQTLATRPDIIGVETSRKLGQLQDAMVCVFMWRVCLCVCACVWA